VLLPLPLVLPEPPLVLPVQPGVPLVLLAVHQPEQEAVLPAVLQVAHPAIHLVAMAVRSQPSMPSTRNTNFAVVAVVTV